MEIDPDPWNLAKKLEAWLATCVTSRTVDPTTGAPYRREVELVDKDFEDVKAIADYAAKQPGQYTITARYNHGKIKVGKAQ